MSSIVLEGALLVVHCLKIVVELGKKRALSSILATAALRASAARSGSKGDIIDIMYKYWLPKFE